jgi:hypothetical protein
MWLYIVIVVVIILIIFLMGSYSARTKAVTKGEIQVAACGPEKPKEPQCTSTARSCAPALETPKPCNRRCKPKCRICRSEDDGFSTEDAFSSAPALFE